MIESIRLDSFESEVLEEKRPVLLAYIRRDHEYKKQTEVLESISERYGDTLKICLLDGNLSGAYKKLGIEGDPTFFVFYKEKEKGRMLGKADRESLCSFVLQALPNFQDNNEAKDKRS